MNLITYGHHLSPRRFRTVYNSRRLGSINKPGGGIWSSPVNSKLGWKDWCRAEGFRVSKLRRYTTFSISDDLKIFKVVTRSDYQTLLKKYGKDNEFGGRIVSRIIDWEALVNDGYRGFWLTETGFLENRYLFSADLGFYSWDCETVVLFYWEDLENISRH